MAGQVLGSTFVPQPDGAAQSPTRWHAGAEDLPECQAEEFMPQQLVAFASVRESMRGRPRRKT